MAEGNSANGVLGVLVGALIVIIVGGGILFATGARRRTQDGNAESRDAEGRFEVAVAAASRGGGAPPRTTSRSGRVT